MKRKIILIITGCVLGFYSYAQNQSQETDIELEEDIIGTTSEDSLELTTDEQNLIIDNGEVEEGNNTGFALPDALYYNEDNVYTPSNVTGNPGPSANGAYDVDGMVNGDLDAKEIIIEPSENTRNPQEDSLRDSGF